MNNWLFFCSIAYTILRRTPSNSCAMCLYALYTFYGQRVSCNGWNWMYVYTLALVYICNSEIHKNYNLPIDKKTVGKTYSTSTALMWMMKSFKHIKWSYKCININNAHIQVNKVGGKKIHRSKTILTKHPA